MSVRKQSAMKKNGEENLRRQSIILVEFCNKNLILCLIDCHLLRRRETWFEVSILTCFSPFLLKSEHDRECELWKCIMSFHLGERERESTCSLFCTICSFCSSLLKNEVTSLSSSSSFCAISFILSCCLVVELKKEES